MSAHRDGRSPPPAQTQYCATCGFPWAMNPIRHAEMCDNRILTLSPKITDCGPDGGCEECDVCRYLNFLEWAGSIGKPDGSTIERNVAMEAYMREKYPATASVTAA